MEEEDEQAEEQPPDPSDLGGVPWKEAVELYAKLRGEESEGEALVDAISRDGDVDEEEEEDVEEEEEDEEEDEETSDGNLFLCCIFVRHVVFVCFCVL